MNTLNSLINYQRRLELELGRKKRIQGRKKWITEKLVLANKELISLDRKVSKEYQDIKDLEKQPLLGFFRRTLESYEKQMNQEKQEYLVAVLEWDNLVNTIEDWNFELTVLSKIDRTLGDIQSKLDRNFSKIKSLIQEMNGDDAIEISLASHEIIRIENRSLEVKEAIEKLDELIDAIEELEEHLETTKNWGSYDIQISKGVFSYKRLQWRKNSYKIISKIDQINQELLKEMRDFDNDIMLKFELDWSLVQNFINPFAYELIDMWVHKKQLNHSLRSLRSLMDFYLSVRETLDGFIFDNEMIRTRKISEQVKLIHEKINKMNNT